MSNGSEGHRAEHHDEVATPHSDPSQHPLRPVRSSPNYITSQRLAEKVTGGIPTVQRETAPDFTRGHVRLGWRQKRRIYELLAVSGLPQQADLSAVR
jgi:hypothetical protein